MIDFNTYKQAEHDKAFPQQRDITTPRAPERSERLKAWQARKADALIHKSIPSISSILSTPQNEVMQEATP